MARYEKKLKKDDEIKLAGLQALVPEELEKHLILNSNRLRTFEDARLEIVTYVEAKYGSRIRPSQRSRGHSDPMEVDAVNSLSSGKRKRVIHGVRVVGVFMCGAAHFSTRMQCKQEHWQTNVCQRQSEQVMVHHGPRVSPHSQAKAIVKRTKGNSKGLSKGTKNENKGSKGAEGSCKGKTLETGISGLENLNSETGSEKSGTSANGTGLYH